MTPTAALGVRAERAEIVRRIPEGAGETARRGGPAPREPRPSSQNREVYRASPLGRATNLPAPSGAGARAPASPTTAEPRSRDLYHRALHVRPSPQPARRFAVPRLARLGAIPARDRPRARHRSRHHPLARRSMRSLRPARACRRVRTSPAAFGREARGRLAAGPWRSRASRGGRPPRADDLQREAADGTKPRRRRRRGVAAALPPSSRARAASPASPTARRSARRRRSPPSISAAFARSPRRTSGATSAAR